MRHSVLIGDTRYLLTDWLDESAQPHRAGVYRRDFPAGPFSSWNGERWCLDAPTAEAAAARTGPSPYQAARWQGLTEPADAAYADNSDGRSAGDHDSAADADADADSDTGIDPDTGVDEDTDANARPDAGTESDVEAVTAASAEVDIERSHTAVGDSIDR